MPEARGWRTTEVTVRGGPAGAAGARRPVLRALLLVLAAVTVPAGVVLGRQDSRPAPGCLQPCGAPGPLVLGAALPLSGVLAPLGAAQRRGVERALDRVDDDGGLDVAGERRRVELLVHDTRSQPDVAGQEALVLARGPYGVVGLLGPCAPPVPVVRVAEARRVPLVTGCQALPAIGGAPLERTWQVAPGDPERATAVFSALHRLPARRAGLFLSTGDDRSAAPWTRAAQQAGVTVVGTYRPQGSDWRAAVARAVRDDVEVVVAVTQAPQGIDLWRELRRHEMPRQPSYFSEAGLGSAWYAAVGPAADGTLTDLVHPGDGAAAGPGEVDEGVSTVSAELTDVLLDGLRRSRTPDRAGLLEALPEAVGQVAGRDVRFLGGRSGRLPVRLARWTDGLLVPLR